MRILLCLNGSNFDGGATRSAAFLASYLRDMGHELTLLLPSEPKGVLLDELQLPYIVIRSYLWAYLKNTSGIASIKLRIKLTYNNLVSVPTISRLLRKKRFDLVVLNNSWMYVAAVAAKKASVPHIWHIREYTDEDFPDYKIWKRDRALQLMSEADMLICVAKGIYEKYRTILPEANVELVYNGIDPSKFDRERRPLFNSNIVQMCIVGMLLKTKGQDQLIEALSIVKENEPGLRFQLRIVGPSTASELKRHKDIVQRLGLTDEVAFVGAVSDTAPILLSSDISFTCSRMEAFGRVTVEAMMAGCLVIGANTGGTSEIIQNCETGILYRRESTSDLAERILFALRNVDKSRRIAEKGKREALEKYTALRNAREIDALYRRAVQGNGK